MDDYTATRVSLHGVAECLLAGPQYATSTTIRLRVLQGGFATVAAPMLRVSGTDLVREDGRRVRLAGPFAEVAAAAGVAFTVPDFYADHSGVGPHDQVVVDLVQAARIASWFDRGRQALTLLDPAQPPVLWPEHFDLAITIDEVNLGVSPGDRYWADPYAYVGPWDFDPDKPGYQGPFFNAAFGAVLPAAGAPDTDALARFFRGGLHQVRQARVVRP